MKTSNGMWPFLMAAMLLSATASADESTLQTAVFNHAKGGDKGVKLKLADRERFVVRVEGTCAAYFKVMVKGVKGIVATPALKEFNGDPNEKNVLASGDPVDKDLAEMKSAIDQQIKLLKQYDGNCPTGDAGVITTPDMDHDAKYGGYVVEVKRKEMSEGFLKEVPKLLAKYPVDGLSKSSPKATAEQLAAYHGHRAQLLLAIHDYQILVSDPVRMGKDSLPDSYVSAVLVDNSEWQVVPAGAFTLSKLRSHRYTLGKRTVMTDDGQGNQVPSEEQFVRRNKGADDDWALGLAGLVHVTNSDWTIPCKWIGRPKFALTFGLGYAEGGANSINYFMGPSFAWDQLYMTLGYNIGTVDILPRGLRDGDVVETGQQIDPMESRTDGAWFLSFSYSFLSSGVTSSLQKPLADARGPN